VITSKSILPFYAKAGIFLVGLSALLAILYIAQGIIVPLVFAFIIAILLHPLVNLFVRIRINRILAIFITLLLTILVLAAFIALIYTQAVSFGNSWPILVQKFTVILNDSISYVSRYFEIKPSLIHAWITKTQHELITIDSTLIGNTIVTVGSTMANL